MRQRYINQKRSAVTLIVLSLVIGPILLANSGCSVVMATKQPGKKDLSVLDEGTPRVNVVAELGAPLLSEEEDGHKVDIFAFKQGYSSGSRAGRAFFHGVADVFTLGLWEVVGTPIEATATGTDMKLEVVYDENDLVKTVTYLEVEKPEASADVEETLPAMTEETLPAMTEETLPAATKKSGTSTGKAEEDDCWPPCLCGDQSCP